MQRILLVDPNSETRGTTRRKLVNGGFDVDEAESIASLDPNVNWKDYDLIVTDIHLPDQSGVAVVEHFRQNTSAPELIVLTHAGTLEQIIGCMRAGAADFVIKTCSGQDLCTAVNKAIHKREISQANVMLRSLNEMKDKFLTLVSHELRTPLTLIFGYLVILHRQRGSLAEDQAELLEIILRATKNLMNIVDNIQLLTQAEKGEMKLHRQSLQPRKLMADVVGEVMASLDSRRLNLHLQEGEDPGSIVGDSIRLRQSLIEILQNAIKNTPDGGTITAGADREEDHVVLWVRDTGVGIPKDKQREVFEPFYEVNDVQLHTSSASKFGGGGIGIGLALVKAVVEAHEGSICLESEPQRGTRVEIRLPVSEEAPLETSYSQG